MDGVNTGIFANEGLKIRSKELVVNINPDENLKEAHSNSGIYSISGLLDIEAQTISIDGASNGIYFSNHLGAEKKSISSDVLILNAGLAQNVDELSNSIHDYKKSTGIRIEGSKDIELSAKTLLIKDYSNGLILTPDSDFSDNVETFAENAFIVNEQKKGGYGIAILAGTGKFNSDSLHISGYKVAVNASDRDVSNVNSTFVSKSDYTLNLREVLSIEQVDTGFSAENSKIKINSLSTLLQTNAGGKAFSLMRQGEIHFSSSQQTVVAGDIDVQDSVFEMDVGDNSYLKGKAVNSGSGTLNLKFGANSQWIVADRSNVTSLAGSGMTVSLMQTGSIDLPTLDIDSLEGSGNTFVLETNSDLSSISFLNLGKTPTGTTQTVKLSDSLNFGKSDEINVQFASDASGNTVFEADPSLADAGLFVVTPELDSIAKDSGGKDWFITNIEKTPAPTPVSIIDGMESNYFFWRGLSESTRERFGQLRHGQSVGVWGRAAAGSLSYGSIQNDYQTYRLGADGALNADWRVGILAERHEGKLDSSTGRGDMSATTASIYALYVGECGFYADGGLRFGIMDYEYANRSLLPDSYDYKSSALGGWLEIGHEWEISGGWTVSPHASFSYGRFSAENFTTANGLKAAADSVDSGIFTLGADFGFKLDGLELLFTADAKHEALGDQTIKVSHESSSIRQSVDYSDTWAEYGINLSYRPSDQSLVWLNVRRSSFADVEQDWKINLGARWLLD